MILSHPFAPVGSVTRLPRYAPSDFPATAAVLCRNTAPLMAFAFALFERDVSCHVVGKDIEVGLQQLVTKLSGNTMFDFRTTLAHYEEAECAKLTRKGKREASANLSDKCEALRVISRSCQSTAQLQGKIKALFESGAGLTLSTIHKAKGLEWETVFLLDWNLLPSPYAETPAQRQQERNLQYVAVTRAKLNLVFINSNQWKP